MFLFHIGMKKEQMVVKFVKCIQMRCTGKEAEEYQR